MANNEIKGVSLKTQESLKLQSIISDIEKSHQKTDDLLALLFHERSKTDYSLSVLQSFMIEESPRVNLKGRVGCPGLY